MTNVLQPFKRNDAVEAQVAACFLAALNPLGIARDAFFAGADSAYPLGDVLFTLDRSPVAKAIGLENFRRTFFAIHNYFDRPGTFEFYLTLFRAIWGALVTVTFEVPSPGILLISVDALNLEIFDLAALLIESNVYVQYAIVTETPDNIVVRIPTGIRSEADFDLLITEISPAGINVIGTLF